MTSIAQQDKLMMKLQQQIEGKEAQLKQDYKRLARDVKDNPYLEVALDEYKAYMLRAKAEKEEQIKALTVLLKHIENVKEAQGGTNEMDTNEIKREIIQIKRK